MDRTEEFQLKLTILTIIGMLVSGFLGGFTAYKLNQEDPLIVISPQIRDLSYNQLNFSVSNFNNKPAREIELKYLISGVHNDYKSTFEYIPTLFKGTEIVSIDFENVNKQIINDVEEIFLNSSFISILQEDKFYYLSDSEGGFDIGYTVDENKISPVDTTYHILISAKCKECDIILPNPIYYHPHIYCKKSNEGAVCEIRGTAYSFG